MYHVHYKDARYNIIFFYFITGYAPYPVFSAWLFQQNLCHDEIGRF